MYILSVRYSAKCDGFNSSKGGSLQKKNSPEQAISMILYYHVYLNADYYFID